MYGPGFLIVGVGFTVSALRSKKNPATLGIGILLIAVGILMTALRVLAYLKAP
jgi:hypothetical protein